MLKIEDLSFSYPRKRHKVLQDINLEIAPGGVYGLLGRNGVGKSTLLYLIAGLLTPKSGTVTYNGVKTLLRRPDTLADIFIVPETISLPKIKLDTYVRMQSQFYPNFSVEDLKRHLQLFDMPYDINIGQLSMGQAKKVFMSFALATNTSLMLMDEPTNGLDIPSKAAFRGFIASSMNEQRSIVISTHQVQDINLLLDHVVIMENSGVLLNTSVANILSRLSFTITDDRKMIDNALFALPSIQGTNIITRNNDGEETQLNLETLFELTTKHPALINEIFTSKTQETL